MSPADRQRLLLSLRELGAVATLSAESADGHDFSLGGVSGSFVVGPRTPEEHKDGEFTICRVPLPWGSPAFVMEVRPQTPREQRDVARGDAIDVDLGDPELHRAFVVEAAPSSIARAVLDQSVRAGLLALTPCWLTASAGELELRKPGTWTKDQDVDGIVGVCLRVRERLGRLPEGLAYEPEAVGYRGERLESSPEAVARASEEIAEVERVRRTRRQITNANAGLVVLGLLVAAMLVELLRG